MDLRRLEIFVKVVELGSFSRAADALALTQPTVSEHLRALEDELGVRLVDRLGRGAVATRGGQLLLGYARRMMALATEARQAIDQFQGRVSGELVIGGSTIPGEYVLPALAGRFKEKHQHISLTLLIGSTRAVIEWVEEGRVEVAVVGARPTQRALVARELMPDELVVVVAAGHPWASRRSVTLAELEREPLVERERGSGSRDALERALAQHGLDLRRFRIAGEIGSTQAIKQAVRARVGVALISHRAVEDECRAGLVHCVKVKDLRVSRAFYLVTHRERTRSPLARAFVQFLESEAHSEAS